MLTKKGRKNQQFRLDEAQKAEGVWEEDLKPLQHMTPAERAVYMNPNNPRGFRRAAFEGKKKL